MTGARSGYVPLLSADYPPLLKEIKDPPLGLYYRGNYKDILREGVRMVGVVGTRAPSQYGIETTKKLCHELAGLGVVIVSGLAKGIDAVAHKAALDRGGQTVAVLGCGIDLAYPPENKALYEQIIRKGSLVLSEYPGKTLVPTHIFTARNRIISGLCKATVVIEGSKHSGTLLTAKYAAQQGREVLALPGELGKRGSEAPLILIKEGAIPLLSIEDVLAALD